MPLLVDDPRAVGMPLEDGGLEKLGENLRGLPGLLFLYSQALTLEEHGLLVEAQVAQTIRLHGQNFVELLQRNLVIVEERVVLTRKGIGAAPHLLDQTVVLARARLRRARVHGVLGEMGQPRGARCLVPLAGSHDHEDRDTLVRIPSGYGAKPVAQQTTLEDVLPDLDGGQIPRCFRRLLRCGDDRGAARSQEPEEGKHREESQDGSPGLAAPRVR